MGYYRLASLYNDVAELAVGETGFPSSRRGEGGEQGKTQRRVRRRAAELLLQQMALAGDEARCAIKLSAHRVKVGSVVACDRRSRHGARRESCFSWARAARRIAPVMLKNARRLDCRCRGFVTMEKTAPVHRYY